MPIHGDPSPRTATEPQLKMPTDPDSWHREGDIRLEVPKTPNNQNQQADDTSPITTPQLRYTLVGDSPVEAQQHRHEPRAMSSGARTPTRPSRKKETGPKREDGAELFDKAWESSGEYTLAAAFVAPQSLGERLQGEKRNKDLNDNGPRILRDSSQEIVMWETLVEPDIESPEKSVTSEFDGPHNRAECSSKRQSLTILTLPGFHKYGIGNASELDKHLQRPGFTPDSNSDPATRVILLASDEHKGLLPCGREMLNKLFTYFQVDHSFIEAIRSFEYTLGFARLPSAAFWGRSTASVPPGQLVPLARQCRSGREIAMSFALHTIRPDDYGQWPIEKRAIYSWFDLETGRSTWLVVSDDDGEVGIGCSVRERIQKMLDSYPLTADDPAVNNEVTVPKRFEAFLEHYLFFVAWCEENWGDFTAAVNTEVGRILERAQGNQGPAYLKRGRERFPPAVPSPPMSPEAPRQPQRHGLSRGLNRGRWAKNGHWIAPRGSVSLGPEPATSRAAEALPRATTREMGLGLHPLQSNAGKNARQLEKNTQQEDALRALCYEDVQALHAIAVKVHAAKEAAFHNADVVAQTIRLLRLELDANWDILDDERYKFRSNIKSELKRFLKLAEQSQHRLEVAGGRLGHMGEKLAYGAQRVGGSLYHKRASDAWATTELTKLPVRGAAPAQDAAQERQLVARGVNHDGGVAGAGRAGDSWCQGGGWSWRGSEQQRLDPGLEVQGR